MNTLIALALVVSAAPQVVHQWTFDGADTTTWQPNSFLSEVEIKEGALHARAIDWDPFFVCDGVEIPTAPWQVLVLRVKASKAGRGNLFWTGDTSGANGGLSEQRQTPFGIADGGEWQEVAIYPFWQSAGTLKKLRLDVYDDATFAIDSITIYDWAAGREATGKSSWTAEDMASWSHAGDGRQRWAPPVSLDGDSLPWASVTVTAEREGVGALLWASEQGLGGQQQEIAVTAGTRTYNLEMAGVPGWEDIVAVGVQVPGGSARVTSLTLGETPSGPADIELIYFGVEDGINRVGHPVRVTAQFTNRGGALVPEMVGALTGPEGLSVTPVETSATNLDFESRGVFTWTVQSEEVGEYPLSLILSGGGETRTATATVSITEGALSATADYVPAPRPVKTSVDIAAYYFPGWDSPAKWDPVQRVAPMRKPVLGWYDEANPEIVDWQIKWAVENGISVFLLDWYWVKGSQHLQHWFEAYKKSRYRDQLKIALMWANHNAPGTHSADDWKTVSDHWIAEYFTLDSYYHMDGKPAVFLWDHRNIRNDLGGSEAVAAAFGASQEAAQAAGFEGIHYVGLHPWGAEATMAKEGYHGVTRYHEWGDAQAMAEDPQRLLFSNVADTVMGSWERQRESQGELTYYPVVDTGWDSRPWHGNRAKAILGRTPALFTKILEEAKVFVEKTDVPLVILGPMNEWGEGSYIEPNTEFGFEMMNAVRNVFGVGDPATWPPNVAPVDVALGPYDFPQPERQHYWTFDTGAEGWQSMMGLSELRIDGGALSATTYSRDPAFVIPLRATRAKDFSGVRIRMAVTGDLPASVNAQLFWSRGGVAVSEATSLRFPVATDGQVHEYTLNLADNPRWRGEITMFRFDPCDVKDVTVVVEEFELVPVGD